MTELFPSQSPAPTTRRARKRRILLIVGFLVALGGSVYAYLSRPPSETARGWDAYHAGRYEEARTYFTRALEQNGKSVDAYTGRGWAEVGLKQWDEAIADSSRAIELSPDAAMAYVARADARSAQGQVKEALADLDEAIRCDRACASAYFHRARIRFYHTQDAIEPLADVLRAIRLNPDFAPAYSLKGLLLFDLKRYDAAIDACNRALELDPQEATALLYRGEARLAKGLTELGERDLQKAFRLNPSLRPAPK